MSSYGLYGPRPGSGAPVASDPEKTPVVCHERPAPVVVRSGTVPKQPPPLPRVALRTATPLGGTLSPLGRTVVPDPEVFSTDESPTETRQAAINRLLRTCVALSFDDLRLVTALALRLRPGVGD